MQSSLRRVLSRPLARLVPAYLCRFAVRAPGDLAAKLFLAAWDYSLRERFKLARTPVSALVRSRIYLGPRPTRLARHDRSPVELPFCVPPRLVTSPKRGRNVDRLCIGYAFRPHLSSRLTLRGRTFRKKPQAYGGRDSHPPFRYSCLHSHFCLVQRSSRSAFTLLQNAPLPPRGGRHPRGTRGFGAQLEPRYIFGAAPLDQ